MNVGVNNLVIQLLSQDASYVIPFVLNLFAANAVIIRPILPIIARCTG
jgi:hypothetical protein